MRVRCKVERLRANVQNVMRKHFESERQQIGLFGLLDSKASLRKKQARFDTDVRKTMQVISDANSTPVAVDQNSDLFQTLKPIRYTDEYKYRDSQFFLFRDSVYAATGPYTQTECALLVSALRDKERKMFESLSKKQDGPEVRQALAQRGRIPEKVRIAVWRRDQGQCARCGSRRNLEYDHIIPIAEGGGNTARNIELLCETCNRMKGKRIE